jgi:hypothetical protein
MPVLSTTTAVWKARGDRGFGCNSVPLISGCDGALALGIASPGAWAKRNGRHGHVGLTPTSKSGKKYEMKTVDRLRSSEFERAAPVRGLFGGGSVYFAFEQLSACPPKCEVGLVCADRFEMVTNHVVIIYEAFDFQLRNCGRIG